MAKQLQMTLLGNPNITLDGQPVTGFISRKAPALLYYLAVTGQPYSRDKLANLLWGEKPDVRARSNLRDVLADLRRRLPSPLSADRQTVAFNRAINYVLDVETFVTHILNAQVMGTTDLTAVTAQQLNEAMTLYRGEFLAGFHVPGEDAFEEWSAKERERLRQLALQALGRLVPYHVRHGEYDLGIAAARRLLAIDPWCEATHRQLMQLYAWSKQRSAALVQYETCRQVLAAELDVKPAVITTTLYEQIRDGLLVEPPVDDSAHDLVPMPSRQHNLPSQLTFFVGREAELSQTASLLKDTNCRLLTLAGPGGVGKTALALQAARQVLSEGWSENRFPQGVYFLPLAAVETAHTQAANALALTIAAALQLSFSGTEPAPEQLLDYVRQKDMLLILDNFEHLLTAVPFLVNLLEQAPRLKIMVTSRVRLNAPGEQLLELDGLPFPKSAKDLSKPDLWPNYDAIQLFRQCARNMQLDFTLTTTKVAAVIHICRLVEGLPLGIELAAGWTRVLSCQEIAQEIEKSLGFLHSSARHEPQRHQSLNAVFEQSWRLLSDAERRALRQLSVFRGSFTHEAAAQVAGATPLLLFSLVDNSLARRAILPDDNRLAARLELPEVARQFAAAKLAETQDDEKSEQAATKKRHGHYYLTFLQERRADLHGERQQSALIEIGTEIDNIRAAWRWAVGEGDASVIGLAMESLFHFYDIRSWFQEGEEAFSRAVSRLAELQMEDTAEEVKVFWGMALARQGWFTFQLGRQVEAKILLEESLTMLRPLGAPGAMTFSLNYLAAATYYLGDYEDAQRLCREGLTVSQVNGDCFGEAIAKNILSQILYLLGQYTEAKQYGLESLSIGRKIGNRWHEAFSLTNLGAVAYASGTYREAQSLFQKSLTIREAIGDKRGTAICFSFLADTAQAQEEYKEAQQLYQSSLAIFEGIGNRSGMTDSLTKLGHLAVVRSEMVLARAHFRKALQLSHRIQALPKILDVIGGFASLLVETNPERAFFLAVIVQEHQATTTDSKIRASQLINNMVGQDYVKVLKSVQTQVLTVTVDTVVNELLEIPGQSLR